MSDAWIAGREADIGEAFALGRDGGPRNLRIANQLFVRALVCPACGERRDVHLQLLGRLRAALRTCARCGQPLRASGADAAEWLSEDDVEGRMREVPLASLGVHAGDVVSVAGASCTAHFQMGGLS